MDMVLVNRLSTIPLNGTLAVYVFNVPQYQKRIRLERNFVNSEKKIDGSQESSFKRYTLKPTYTPLPSQEKTYQKEEDQQLIQSDEDCTTRSNNKSLKSIHTPPSLQNSAEKTKASQSVLRAANEDDDLYDPYSDVHDGTLKPLTFEKDPWN